jgi:hypothetical protein
MMIFSEITVSHGPIQILRVSVFRRYPDRYELNITSEKMLRPEC